MSSASRCETRLANSVALITGALPAQYGLRTAGIIDIQTKTGTLDPGGSVTLYGGQQGVVSAERRIRRSRRPNRLLRDRRISAQHDRDREPDRQQKRDPRPQQPAARLCLCRRHHRPEYATERHARCLAQPVPDPEHPEPHTRVSGSPSTASPISPRPTSTKTSARSTISRSSLCRSVLGRSISRSRHSTGTAASYFSPGDPTGPILFTGIGQTAYRRSIATGTQGDGSWQISPEHTLRSGFYIQGERSTFKHHFRCSSGGRHGHANHRHAPHDLRFGRQDGMALQLLPAGRMENRSDPYAQFWRAL